MTLIKRRLGGLIVSAALHAIVVALLLIESKASAPISKETAGETSRRPRAVIFVVPPAVDALPGLRPGDDKDEDRSEKISGRPLLSLPGLTLNFQKVAARSNLLFPVIAPGLALEQ